MAKAFANANTGGGGGISRGTSDGVDVQLRALRDGALITAPWYFALVAEGRVFGCNVGTGSTPVTMNAAYAAGEQDLYTYVPTPTCIIPLEIQIATEDSGTALAQDVLAAYSSNGDSAVTGTAITAYNYRTNASLNSACTVTSVVTSNGTTHLGGDDFLEFWRPYAGFGEDAFNSSTGWVNNQMHGVSWSAMQRVPPIIGGSAAGALSLYLGSQAGIGFFVQVWAELDYRGL